MASSWWTTQPSLLPLRCAYFLLTSSLLVVLRQLVSFSTAGRLPVVYVHYLQKPHHAVSISNIVYTHTLTHPHTRTHTHTHAVRVGCVQRDALHFGACRRCGRGRGKGVADQEQAQGIFCMCVCVCVLAIGILIGSLCNVSRASYVCHGQPLRVMGILCVSWATIACHGHPIHLYYAR